MNGLSICISYVVLEGLLKAEERPRSHESVMLKSSRTDLLRHSQQQNKFILFTYVALSPSLPELSYSTANSSKFIPRSTRVRLCTLLWRQYIIWIELIYIFIRLLSYIFTWTIFFVVNRYVAGGWIYIFCFINAERFFFYGILSRTEMEHSLGKTIFRSTRLFPPNSIWFHKIIRSFFLKIH